MKRVLEVIRNAGLVIVAFGAGGMIGTMIVFLGEVVPKQEDVLETMVAGGLIYMGASMGMNLWRWARRLERAIDRMQDAVANLEHSR